mgnify:CR=1 FL=1
MFNALKNRSCISIMLTLLATNSSLYLDAAAEQQEQSIVFLGDSLTAGFELPPEQAYPALIQQEIAKLGLKFRVVNAGVSGDTTADALARLAWVMKNGADILVIALGANDGLRGLPPSLAAGNLRAIIDQARKTNPQIRVVLAGILVPTNMGPEYNNEFARIFPEIAAEKKAILVPFLLEGVAARPELNLPDGLHPNQEGHKIIAQTVWKKLAPLLDDAAKPSKIR